MLVVTFDLSSSTRAIFIAVKLFSILTLKTTGTLAVGVTRLDLPVTLPRVCLLVMRH